MASTVALRGELLHQLRVLRRPDEADQGAAIAQEANFLRRRHAYLENDIGFRPQPGGGVDDPGARGAVGLVAAIRRISGAGFDGHRETQLDQFFDDLGYGRNPLFPSSNLLWNSDC
jgi:hypothetical protein